MAPRLPKDRMGTEYLSATQRNNMLFAGKYSD